MVLEALMATLSELVVAIAKVEDIDPATVGLIARQVREAKLITMSGRGPSAAKMSFTDAANLLIAVNATKHANEAVRAVTFYRPMVPHEVEGTANARPLEEAGTFGQAVEQLLEAAAVGMLPNSFLGKIVPKQLQDGFSKGNVRIALKFNITFFGAALRMTPPPSKEAIDHLSHESVVALPSSGFSFDFLPSVRRRSPRIKERFGDRISYSTFRAVIGDRIEETTIGYRTVKAVGKLIQPEQAVGK
jgi:hypothetical protein